MRIDPCIPQNRTRKQSFKNVFFYRLLIIWIAHGNKQFGAFLYRGFAFTFAPFGWSLLGHLHQTQVKMSKKRMSILRQTYAAVCERNTIEILGTLNAFLCDIAFTFAFTFASCEQTLTTRGVNICRTRGFKEDRSPLVDLHLYAIRVTVSIGSFVKVNPDEATITTAQHICTHL